ncbi:TM2 domain-containing protein [Candidatus Electrothrix gigas]
MWQWDIFSGFLVSWGCTAFTMANRFPAQSISLRLGLVGIGWLVDLFLIPGMDREADLRFAPGPIDYNIAWILLVFLGAFGVHRMYMGKWLTGIIYLLTGGVFLLGILYDLWTMNEQLSLINTSA